MSVSQLLSNVRVSGSNVIYNANLTGIGGTQVFVSGQYVVVSGITGGGGGGAGDVTYSQLLGASGALQNQIDNISISGSSTSLTGDERIVLTQIPTGVDSYFIQWSPNYVTTPLAVLATLEITGTKLYSINVKDRTVSGYTVLFSNTVLESGVFVNTYARQGSIISANERVLNTTIPTGIDNYFIQWTPNFPSIPTMIQATLGVTGDNLYDLNIRGKTISGYTAIFSDLIAESGVYVNTYARF